MVKHGSCFSRKLQPHILIFGIKEVNQIIYKAEMKDQKKGLSLSLLSCLFQVIGTVINAINKTARQEGSNGRQVNT